MIAVNNRNTQDPFINLAIEEFLVRQATPPDQGLVFFYSNKPCVVLGKNQSIYKEVNLAYWRSGELVMARRISGGGTVYQDAGNLNFAFISRFDDFKVNNYKYFNRPVVEALIYAGIPAEMDNRNNILAAGKKVSGNAQFTNRKNILSHGTLLVCANLDRLRGSLRENDFEVETKAVSSVRSSVINLANLCPALPTAEAMKDYLCRQLAITDELNFEDKDWRTIEQLAQEKYASFNWIYGRSPHSKIRKNGWYIAIEKGCIESISGAHELAKEINECLIGVPYAYPNMQQALANRPPLLELLPALF